MRISYNETQFSTLLKKLEPSTLSQPLKNFFDRAGITVLNAAKINAPVDTGRLRSSLGKGAVGGLWEQDNSEVPGWLKVGTNVKQGAFSYPFALEESPRYHYRGTRPDLQGLPTKGWFSRALTSSLKSVHGFLVQLGQEIQRAWNK